MRSVCTKLTITTHKSDISNIVVVLSLIHLNKLPEIFILLSMVSITNHWQVFFKDFSNMQRGELAKIGVDKII